MAWSAERRTEFCTMAVGLLYVASCRKATDRGVDRDDVFSIAEELLIEKLMSADAPFCDSVNAVDAVKIAKKFRVFYKIADTASQRVKREVQSQPHQADDLDVAVLSQPTPVQVMANQEAMEQAMARIKKADAHDLLVDKELQARNGRSGRSESMGTEEIGDLCGKLGIQHDEIVKKVDSIKGDARKESTVRVRATRARKSARKSIGDTLAALLLILQALYGSAGLHEPSVAMASGRSSSEPRIAEIDSGSLDSGIRAYQIGGRCALPPGSARDGRHDLSVVKPGHEGAGIRAYQIGGRCILPQEALGSEVALVEPDGAESGIRAYQIGGLSTHRDTSIV